MMPMWSMMILSPGWRSAIAPSSAFQIGACTIVTRPSSSARGQYQSLVPSIIQFRSIGRWKVSRVPLMYGFCAKSRIIAAPSAGLFCGMRAITPNRSGCASHASRA